MTPLDIFRKVVDWTSAYTHQEGKQSVPMFLTHMMKRACEHVCCLLSKNQVSRILGLASGEVPLLPNRVRLLSSVLPEVGYYKGAALAHARRPKLYWVGIAGHVARATVAMRMASVGHEELPQPQHPRHSITTFTAQADVHPAIDTRRERTISNSTLRRHFTWIRYCDQLVQVSVFLSSHQRHVHSHGLTFVLQDSQ